MRIGVLTTSYPRHQDDFSGAFVADFSRYLVTHVGSVEVIAAHPRWPLFYRGGAPLKLKQWRNFPVAAAFTGRFAATLYRRVQRYDALVSHWLLPSALLGAAFAPDKPHLAIAHGSDVRLIKKLGGDRLLSWLSKRADLVTVARALTAHGRVVPMGIDVDQFSRPADLDRHQLRKDLGLDRVTLLFLGRLVPEKGVDRLLRALPENAYLVIAGDGAERARLERLASGKPVRFLGEVLGQKKRDWLWAADLLVVPSQQNSEGAPTVIAEALAAGLPIVAMRAGGIAEMCKDGSTALLVDSEAELRRALSRVVGDKSLRALLSRNGTGQARAFDWSVIGPQLAASLVNENRPTEVPITVLRV